MSQESNTENNSEGSPKKRLSLKKKAGGEQSAESVSKSPSKPSKTEPYAPEDPAPKKPIRIGLKKKAESSSESSSSEPLEFSTRRPEASESTPSGNTPPVKIGLKTKKTDAEPQEATRPDSIQPAPAAPIQAASPSPPPIKNTPIANADAPAVDEGRAMPSSPASETMTPQLGGESRPPVPPPGIKIRKDEDDAPALALKSLGGVAPPPIPPTPDLIDEEIEAEKKKSGGGHHVNGLIVAAFILIVLVGGIGFLAWGVFGMFQDSVGEAAVTPSPAETPAQPAAPDPTPPQGPQLATDEPKSFLGKVAKLTQEVSAKASTDEITDFAESIGNPPAPVPAPEAPAEPVTVSVGSAPVVGITRDGESAPVAVRPTGDPQVRDWIQSLRPSGVGRGMMILNDEKFRVGEVVNPELNVRWVGLDQQLGILIFEDPYGVRYEKDY